MLAMLGAGDSGLCEGTEEVGDSPSSYSLPLDDGRELTVVDWRSVKSKSTMQTGWTQHATVCDILAAEPNQARNRHRFWHSPMVLPGRGVVESIITELFRELDDAERVSRILAKQSDREAFTKHCHRDALQRGVSQINTAGSADAVTLMPGCDWCGMPTGCWCEGYRTRTHTPRGSAPATWVCNRPICSICERVLHVCWGCSVQVGVPAST